MGRKRPLASGRRPDIAGHGSQGHHPNVSYGWKAAIGACPQSGPFADRWQRGLRRVESSKFKPLTQLLAVAARDPQLDARREMDNRIAVG